MLFKIFLGGQGQVSQSPLLSEPSHLSSLPRLTPVNFTQAALVKPFAAKLPAGTFLKKDQVSWAKFVISGPLF